MTLELTKSVTVCCGPQTPRPLVGVFVGLLSVMVEADFLEIEIEIETFDLPNALSSFLVI